MFKINIMGNIGNDAQIKTTPSGELVTEFSLAVSIGNKQNPKTEWVKCAYWGDAGKNLCQYLTKGTPLNVFGVFAGINTWTDKDNVLQKQLGITVKEVHFQHGKKEDQSSAKSDNYPAQTYTPAAPYNQPDTDDLPF